MPRPSIGEPFHCGDFFDGPRERIFAEIAVVVGLQRTGEQLGVTFSTIEWEVMKPGDPRVPEPIRNSRADVRGIEFLVGTACVLAHLDVSPVTPQFVREMHEFTLVALRGVVRAAHLDANPGAVPLTEARCDGVIGDRGPIVAGVLDADEAVPRWRSAMGATSITCWIDNSAAWSRTWIGVRLRGCARSRRGRRRTS